MPHYALQVKEPDWIFNVPQGESYEIIIALHCDSCAVYLGFKTMDEVDALDSEYACKCGGVLEKLSEPICTKRQVS